MEILNHRVEIDRDDFTYLDFVNDSEIRKSIPKLNEVITYRPILFKLRYPFEMEYNGRIIDEDGITLKKIINAIRWGMKLMYKDSNYSSIPNFFNSFIYSDKYGFSSCGIGDLYIENIVFKQVNSEYSAIYISIGT